MSWRSSARTRSRWWTTFRKSPPSGANLLIGEEEAGEEEEAAVEEEPAVEEEEFGYPGG